MKAPKSRAGLGASSILLIIVVLCLTAFGTLTLITAQVEERLTERTVAAQQAYYEADAAAQEAICLLQQAIVSGESTPDGWTETSDGVVRQFPISDDMVIEVKAVIEENGCRITGYQTINLSEWTSASEGLIWG